MDNKTEDFSMESFEKAKTTMLENKTDKTVDKLAEAGFDKASQKLSSVDRAKKAYADYQVVTSEQLEKFDKELQRRSRIETRDEIHYKKLDLIAIEDYDETPPDACLDAIIKAKETKLFDRFELAKLVWTHEEKIKDPIVFGRIEGISDRFFITQWDDDISLKDIIGE